MILSDQYVAGIIDGEGCFTLVKDPRVNSIAPRVQILITYLPVLEAIYVKYGGRIRQMKRQESHHKTSWVWSISKHKEITSFCLAVYPFLLEKSPQCALMLDFLSWRKQWTIRNGPARGGKIEYDKVMYMVDEMKRLKYV